MLYLMAFLAGMLVYGVVDLGLDWFQARKKLKKMKEKNENESKNS